MTHVLSFLDVTDDLPVCRNCGREVTQQMWLDDDECRGHPLDRVDDAGISRLERWMFREHGR